MTSFPFNNMLYVVLRIEWTCDVVFLRDSSSEEKTGAEVEVTDMGMLGFSLGVTQAD